jgi:hypothetical protein
MNRMLAAIAAVTLGIAAVGSGAAREAQRSAAGLAETLEFIRDKVAEQGQIIYSASFRDTADGQNWTNSFSVEASNVTDDVSSCSVSFHWHTTTDGAVKYDGDTDVSFRKVASVIVTDMEADFVQANVKAGHPTWTSDVNPTVWVVTVRHTDGLSNVLDFRDQSMANRVATAMRHAANLCGKAKREPF